MTQHITIHRGPIPGTTIGHHWFEASDGNRYGISGWPHGVNKGWTYEVVDERGDTVDDSMFSLAEIREWAAWAPARAWEEGYAHAKHGGGPVPNPYRSSCTSTPDG